MALPTKQELLNIITANLADESTISAAEHRAVELMLVDAIYGGQVGDIKEIACDPTYINDNFITGLGNINEGRALVTSDRYGWAICNGKNGTINKKGKVSIGYDPSNYPIGTSGGNKDAKIISHSHYIAVGNSQTITNVNSLYNGSATNRKELGLSTRAYGAALDYELVTTSGTIDSGKTSTIGESGTNGNMQPYVVTLFIQRIPAY